jgi:hypothetical protein
VRRRRDSVGRCSYVPVRDREGQCAFCGQRDPRDTRRHALADTTPRHRCYTIEIESDGGRTTTVTGAFCSWACAEAYHSTTFPH